jgi:uncharacterized Zn finger protein
MWYGFRPYVSVAQRRRQAARERAQAAKRGQIWQPVVIPGRTIAHTFWGRAWCDNLERYSDFANRLPRGRTYARNGSVVDLQVKPGQLAARVSGSSLYTVKVEVAALPRSRWRAVCTDCAGAIDSLVELLQGRFSQGVMERLCRPQTGLFPSPKEIEFSCSCPDWAVMCKHVAAVLYGVGARLDERPELLFVLRRVDQQDLVAHAGKDLPLSQRGPAREKVLADADLSELFGVDLGGEAPPAAVRPAVSARRVKATKRATVAAPKAGGTRTSAGGEAARRVPAAAARRRKPAAAARRTAKPLPQPGRSTSATTRRGPKKKT